MSKQRYNVKYRLDEVLVEVKGVKAISLEDALIQGREVCLQNLTREWRGMTLEQLDGYPRVVGVETSDAWPEY